MSGTYKGVEIPDEYDGMGGLGVGAMVWKKGVDAALTVVPVKIEDSLAAVVDAGVSGDAERLLAVLVSLSPRDKDTVRSFAGVLKASVEALDTAQDTLLRRRARRLVLGSED